MIVVADTSPLNYLILIGDIDILQPLYDAVAIPRAVQTEMLRPSAPPQVQAWATHLPVWVEVHTVIPKTHLSTDLDAGELEAISLALSLKSPALIIDELIGRAEAQSVGLKVIGTLGILRAAHDAGLLDFASAIQRLQTTNFRIAASVIAALLA